MRRYELTRVRLLRALLAGRWPQFLLQAVALAAFVLAVLAGFIASPVGNRNLSIVAVWIGWWALLVLTAIPLLGRGWCSICPIPLPGEWLQRGNVIRAGTEAGGWGLGKRWPRRLRNMWTQNAGFALLAVFSALILTTPVVSAATLAAFLLIATVVGLIWERRAFCRYLCPVGGFIGLYSQAAPLELRVRDPEVCAAHATKTCYTGSEDGYGCPWEEFPGGLTRNTYCGLCLECLRTCPLDNVAVRVRPMGAELGDARGRRLDEAFKALLLLGSAIVYAAVFLGPWGALKTAAFAAGTMPWWGFAVAFVAVTFFLVPGLFLLATWAGAPPAADRLALRRRFNANAAALIPLGLAAWIAFTLSFAFTNISYLWPVLSDPLGRGWDLLGTADVGWTPYLAGVVPPLIALVLLGGLVWSIGVARRIAGPGAGASGIAHAASPIVLFCFATTVSLLWLLVG